MNRDTLNWRIVTVSDYNSSMTRGLNVLAERANWLIFDATENYIWNKQKKTDHPIDQSFDVSKNKEENKSRTWSQNIPQQLRELAVELQQITTNENIRISGDLMSYRFSPISFTINWVHWDNVFSNEASAVVAFDKLSVLSKKMFPPLW